MSGQIQDRGLFEDASEEGWKKKTWGRNNPVFSVHNVIRKYSVNETFISVVPQVKKLRVFFRTRIKLT